MKAERNPRAFVSGLVWGFLEGTWLFIVPDILLCYWAMKSVRQTCIAIVAVVLGAELAAVVLYALFSYADMADFFARLWLFFPGYKPKMAEVAAGHLALEGGRGLLSGPTSGIPYRAYLLEAWQQKLPLREILVWTPLARLERIVLAPIAVLVLRWFLVDFVGRKTGSPQLWLRVLTVAILVYWIGLYVWYWGSFVPATYG